jgi:hypothetical protein
VASNKENTVHGEIRCKPSDKDGVVTGLRLHSRPELARPAPDVSAAAQANCLDWDWVQGARRSEGATALLRPLPTIRERLSRSSRSVLRSRHSPLHRLFKFWQARLQRRICERALWFVRWLTPPQPVVLVESLSNLGDQKSISGALKMGGMPARRVHRATRTIPA